MLEIKIHKSSSKYYQSVKQLILDNGGTFENDILYLTIPEHELLTAYENVHPLLSMIKNWKGVESTYKGRKVDLFRFLFKTWRVILPCSQEKYNTWNKRYCWLDEDHEGWGCKLITNISLYKLGSGEYKRSNRFWYNFGDFISDNEWKINKGLINERLMNYVENNNIDKCPYFNEWKIKDSIRSLPDTIIVDDKEWKFHYNEKGDKVNIRHINIGSVVVSKMLPRVPLFSN